MNKNNLDLIRKNILNKSKKYVLRCGWNENLFKTVSNKNKLKNHEILALFPDGYLSLLEFYLKELNTEMTENAKNLDLIRMKINKRIREIILLRLKKTQQDKALIKKTYFTLLLPQHFKIASKSLYKTVDQIWFIAGDSSTDFNFYSKRVILSVIYSSTVLYWINNKSFEKTSTFLDKQLRSISKIPQIKNKIINISSFFPNILNIINK